MNQDFTTFLSVISITGLHLVFMYVMIKRAKRNGGCSYSASDKLAYIEEQKLAEMQKQTREIQMMHNNQTIYKHQWK